MAVLRSGLVTLAFLLGLGWLDLGMAVAQEAPAAKPAEAAVLVDGRLTVPGAPADSQTVPSKFSKRNAELDALPTMAFPLPLTDEQRSRIRAAVGKAPAASASARPADLLPSGIDVRELPRDLTAEIPATRNLGYVRTADRILLVSPPSRIVMGEIAAQGASK